jgi:L-lactate dehydrogenase
MTFATYRLSGFPSSRVIGSGTLLDGNRLKCFIAEEFGLDSSQIELEVIGEHGDSMVPLWSRIRYSGETLDRYLAARDRSMDDTIKGRLLQRTKRAGWDIRLANEHSCYGISFSVVRIIETMLGCSSGAPTVSSLASGEYGIDGVCMSLPSILDRDGVKGKEQPVLSEDESRALHASARVLREQADSVNGLLAAG